MDGLRQAIRERILILDGAMGTVMPAARQRSTKS